MKNRKLLFVGFALAAGVFLRGGHAFAATKTWDGGGSDNKFSTAANWNGDSIPSSGDTLVFPASAAPTDYSESLDADITDLSVPGITFSGDSGSSCDSAYKYYRITSGSLILNGAIDISGATGNCWGTVSLPNLALAGDSTVSTTPGYLYLQIGELGQTFAMGAHGLTTATSMGITANITGSGTLTAANGISLDGDNSGYTGPISVLSGVLSVSGSANLGVADLTLPDGVSLSILNYGADSTIANNITLTGSGATQSPKLMYGGSQGGCGDGSYTITLSGTVTLSNDVEVAGYCYTTLNVQNPQLNGHTMTLQSGSTGTLKVGGTTQTPTYQDTTITDSLPGQDLFVSAFERKILNGVRGAVDVYKNGILAGTGTAGTITIHTGGILAPGLSPGCLTSGNLAIDGGIYRAELGGTTACTGYDQMKITGTVTLTNEPVLELSRYNNYKPKAGTTYTIIDNDVAEAISGTFKGMAEGATFKVDGYVYKISYVGGSGNDVVITVVSVPSIPDTGIALIKSNPLATLIGASVAAGAIVLMSRRMKPATKRARR